MSDSVLEFEAAADCLLPMGITSASNCHLNHLNSANRESSGENVAEKYNVGRAKQDDFAAKSFQKAAAAQKAGKFVEEIVPVKTKIVDPKTDEEVEIVVKEDDGIRDGVTAESLGKLKPVFSKTGATHAGNASQVRLYDLSTLPDLAHPAATDL